ncbi:MAG: hypothetical protein ACTHJ4_00675 [Candidatus Nucleicultricaceae bacterium]
MRAFYYIYFIVLATTPASASLSDFRETEKTSQKAEGPSAPRPQIHHIKTFLKMIPHQHEVTLYDDKTNAYYTWTAFWHSDLIQSDYLKLNDENYTQSIQLIDDKGMQNSSIHDQFSAYRIRVTRNKDLEDATSFYGLFYLKAPKPAARPLITDVPLLQTDTIAQFLKPGLSSGSIQLPSPRNPSQKYQWEFRWHTPLSKEFFQTRPFSRYNYHVALIDDAGLEENRSVLHFAAYALWLEDKETHEQVYPISHFYLISPQRL